MKPTVFIDTNCCRNPSWGQLLGNRDELKGVAEIANIVIPSVVIDEILQQKADQFSTNKSKLADNPLVQMREDISAAVEHLSLNDVCAQNREDREITFQEVELLKSASAFERIYELALSKEPPFEIGSDKGFKDACIAVTIEQYIDNSPEDEEVYLLTRDGRLGDFFRQKGPDGRVVVVRTADDLVGKIKVSGRMELAQDDSTANGAAKSVGKEASDEASISDKPLMDWTKDLVGNLRKSSSFAQTHALIKELEVTRNSLSPDQCIELLRSAVENNQIYWLLEDADVKDFFNPIFERYQEYLTEKEYREYLKWSKLPYERAEADNDIYISDEEKVLFNRFSNMMVESLDCIDDDVKFIEDPVEALRNLTGMLSSHLFDDDLQDSQCLARCLLSGSFETKEKTVDLETVRSFVEMLDGSSSKKREAILKNLGSRLDATRNDLLFR